MNFASPAFITLFLPTVLALVYFARSLLGSKAALTMVAACSLAFYAIWDATQLWVIALSLVVNYCLAQMLQRHPANALLTIGIVFNLLLLGGFKYLGLLFPVFSEATGSTGPIASALPLGLSFFTFQQIAFLVDLKAGREKLSSPLEYASFVLFFPQLVAGPIVKHRDLVAQLSGLGVRSLSDPRVVTGLFYLTVGLAKKVLLADPIGRHIDVAWANASVMSFYDAWIATLGYSAQLYLDFSAYSEIAIGVALLFGVQLPINFDSPYKATSVRDFWRRWHITLGAFLRQYLYVPLGGSKQGPSRTLIALWTTMLLGGVWHGAGWTFLLWGGLHAAYMSVEHASAKLHIRPSKALGQFLTLVAVILAWVPFRAHSLSDTFTVFQALSGLNGISVPLGLSSVTGIPASPTAWFTGLEIFALPAFLFLFLKVPNVHELARRFEPQAWIYPAAFATSFLIAMSIGKNATFLYWSW